MYPALVLPALWRAHGRFLLKCKALSRQPVSVRRAAWQPALITAEWQCFWLFWKNARDISKLHLQKAERENLLLAQRDVEAEPYDDHRLHEAEHVRALLSGGEQNRAVRERILRHLASHREKEKKA